MTQRGFSLIELVVVVSIIMVVATVGIGSYRGAKRGILLDIESDKLVALMQTLRTRARTKPQCVGITFGVERRPLQRIEPYDSATKSCRTQEATVSAIAWSDELRIFDISADEASPSELVVRFIPPQGGITIGEASHATIQIGFQGSFPQERQIRINGTTGSIEKIKP